MVVCHDAFLLSIARFRLPGFRRSVGAEVLDVLVPNFMNQLGRSKIDVIMFTPVAAQPQGTGQSALGIDICDVFAAPW